LDFEILEILEICDFVDDNDYYEMFKF